jgi:VIT1/CCC1 family predicted Fe2+/Mn2+ transporter
LFVNRLALDRNRWIKAHVTHVLEFIPSKSVSPARESVTLGLSHLLGATIVLLPYLLLTELNSAAYASTILAAGTLFAAGGLKTKATGGRWYVGAVEFVLMGMVALVAGYLVGSVTGSLL